MSKKKARRIAKYFFPWSSQALSVKRVSLASYIDNISILYIILFNYMTIMVWNIFHHTRRLGTLRSSLIGIQMSDIYGTITVMMPIPKPRMWYIRVPPTLFYIVSIMGSRARSHCELHKPPFSPSWNRIMMPNGIYWTLKKPEILAISPKMHGI